jgi:plastocyanin domain-containing protein
VRFLFEGYYLPATVGVRAGVPTTITFVIKSDSGCGNTVEIPALKKTLALHVGQSRSVHFTPAKNQVIGFACPMKMIKGSVTAH